VGRLRWSIFLGIGEIFEQVVNRGDQPLCLLRLPFVQLLEPGDGGVKLVGENAHDSVFKVLGEFPLHIYSVAENPCCVSHLSQNFTCYKTSHMYYFCYKTLQSPREGRAGLEFLRGRVGAREPT